MTTERTSRLSVLLLAVLLTALNSIKPLHIDDGAYWYYARQFSKQPLDPYGFALQWYTDPSTANEILAPPVLPAWWGLGMRLLGDEPVLWKLWLFPFCWLFVSGLHALFRRFAPGTELLMTWTVALAPTFLPALNLMLDIPALALGLTALRLFFRAGERNSYLLAALAGLIAGLAMQTKYTAALFPGVMLLHALLRTQVSLALVAGFVATLVFAGWEVLMARWYGESHFLHALFEGQPSKIYLIVPFLTLSGGIGAPLLLLALAGLRCSWTFILTTGVFVLAVFGGIALLSFRRQDQPPGMEELIFLLLGCLVLTVLAIVAWRTYSDGNTPLDSMPTTYLFLLLWLLLEVSGYFALTPFPAVRRLMGCSIVAFLLVARLCSINCRTADRWLIVRGVAAFTIILGFTFWAVDLREAFAEQIGATTAVARIHEADPSARVWYLGHWGFQYQMERLGEKSAIKSVVPEYERERQPYVPLPPPTIFHKGDWIIVPDEVHKQVIALEFDKLQKPLPDVIVDDPIPWRTVIAFYGGMVPIRHHFGPRLQIKLYRVTKEFRAQAR